MEELLITVSQADALKKGKQYWEHQYQIMIDRREYAIQQLMEDCSGMEPADILEDFATLQVDSFIRGYRRWIDETFKDTI